MITRFYEVLNTLLGSLESQAYFGTFSIVAIALLVTLLVNKELIRAYYGERAQRWMRMFNVAIVPLLAIFLLTMVIRLWRLLRVSGVL